jgi:hypothetical protein
MASRRFTQGGTRGRRVEQCIYKHISRLVAQREYFGFSNRFRCCLVGSGHDEISQCQAANLGRSFNVSLLLPRDPRFKPFSFCCECHCCPRTIATDPIVRHNAVHFKSPITSHQTKFRERGANGLRAGFKSAAQRSPSFIRRTICSTVRFGAGLEVLSMWLVDAA